MLAIGAKEGDFDDSGHSGKYAERKNGGHSRFHPPVHLHVPENWNGQQGEDDIGQDGDARVEEGREFEVR